MGSGTRNHRTATTATGRGWKTGENAPIIFAGPGKYFAGAAEVLKEGLTRHVSEHTLTAMGESLMKHATKLSSEERREAIVKAVRKVLAEKGFHGTTTRELAEEAGVSEALLFKHFPNKESLYAAMQGSCNLEPAPE